MWTLAAIELVLQILCAIHAAVGRRPGLWRWVVLGVPVVGCLAYIANELWLAAIRGRRDRSMTEMTAPSTARLGADSADGLARRAEAALRQGDPRDAVALYAAALGQGSRQDPALLLGLAKGYFAADEFDRCRQTLAALRALDASFEPGQWQALAARCGNRRPA